MLEWLMNLLLPTKKDAVLPFDIELTRMELSPDSKYVITFDDDKIYCQRPDGDIKTMTWDSIEAVIIITTDMGPFVNDVFWVIHESEGNNLIFPSCASGVDELLAVVCSKLNGWDNEQFIKAMASADNNCFEVWRSFE